MSKLKMFEITLEANSFDGSQVFACYAIDEQDAMLKLKLKLKLKRGECDIIESNVEVLDLDKVPIEIVESYDITSRLLSDVNARQHAIITKQAEQLKIMRHALTEIKNTPSVSSDECSWMASVALEATKPVEE